MCQADSPTKVLLSLYPDLSAVRTVTWHCNSGYAQTPHKSAGPLKHAVGPPDMPRAPRHVKSHRSHHKQDIVLHGQFCIAYCHL